MNEMKIWDPEQGDGLQGDVLFFRVPDSLNINLGREITPKGDRLIIAEGEVTGHHHAIWNRNPPAAFRANEGEGGVGINETNGMLAQTLASVGIAKLYKDPEAVSTLVKMGELTTAELAIGFLIVENGPVMLHHDEHGSIQIPVGRYYVGGQQEMSAAELRRVAD